MKKIFNFIFILTLLLISAVKSEALNFQEAFSKTDRVPMVVLIYANWADGYQNCIKQFRQAQSSLSNVYNFVELDIADKETKAFNERYHINPKLPYILMLRDNGKVARYIQRDCAADEACIKAKLKSFIQ